MLKEILGAFLQPNDDFVLFGCLPDDYYFVSKPRTWASIDDERHYLGRFQKTFVQGNVTETIFSFLFIVWCTQALRMIESRRIGAFDSKSKDQKTQVQLWPRIVAP